MKIKFSYKRYMWQLPKPFKPRQKKKNSYSYYSSILIGINLFQILTWFKSPNHLDYFVISLKIIMILYIILIITFLLKNIVVK